ncbi:helix-turn-helix domain-containing protein [Sanguibacter sp. A246]|uniref:helix-turn-helix domain-containing protein n=1 Tax=Sanguibacter sp. A246 TaxID=3457326 RepID=UPI003FD7EA81
MSIEAMNWVWSSLKALNPSQTLLMLALADHVDEDGICWPSQALLSEKSRMDARSVRRNLTTLAALGLVTVERTSRTRGESLNRYWLDLSLEYVRDEDGTARVTLRGAGAQTLSARPGWSGPTGQNDRLDNSPESDAVALERSPRSGPTGQNDRSDNTDETRSVDNLRLPRSAPTGHSVRSDKVDTALPVDNSGEGTSRPDASVRFEPDAGVRSLPCGVFNHQEEPPPATPATVTAPVPAADATGAAGGPIEPDPPVGVGDEQAVVRDVRAALPRALGDRLSAGPLLGALRPLLEAGWSRQDVVARLEARSWADAGPGLVISVLRDLALEGPPVAAPVQVAASRCEDHGTADAATCSPCWSEIKLGEREAAELGRATGPARASTRSSVHAAAAREQIRLVAGGPR